MSHKAKHLVGRVTFINHINSILMVGKAVNYNAKILNELIEKVVELEEEIEKLKGVQC